MDLNQMILALFSGDGPFTAETLTRKILRMPFVEAPLGDLPWVTKNSFTKTVDIVFSKGGIAMIDAAPRGAEGIDISLGDETIEGFTPPHYPAQATIRAEQIQDRVRALTGGSPDPAAVLLAAESVIADLQKGFLRSFQYLWERQRQQAFNGKIVDKNGRVLVNLTEKFGAAPQKYYADYTVATRNIVKDFSKIKDLIETVTVSGGYGKPVSYKAYCFGAAADHVPWNSYLEKTKERSDLGYASADKVRNTSRFLHADNVEIVKYSTAKSASGVALPNDIDLDGGRGAVLVLPILDDFYHRNVTPMTSFETLTGPGQELYSYIDPYKATRNSQHLGAESNIAHTIALPDATVWWKIDDTNED